MAARMKQMQEAMQQPQMQQQLQQMMAMAQNQQLQQRMQQLKDDPEMKPIFDEIQQVGVAGWKACQALAGSCSCTPSCSTVRSRYPAGCRAGLSTAGLLLLLCRRWRLPPEPGPCRRTL
jgi:hypothetical protein